MKRHLCKVFVLIGSIGLSACTFSISANPDSTVIPAVPTSSLTATGTPTNTASPLRTPTATQWMLSVTPQELDPESEPRGDIVFEKGKCCGEDGIFTITPNPNGLGRLHYVTRQVSNPVWSADGKRIAVNTFRIAPVSEYQGDSDPANIPSWGIFVPGIAVVNADGTQFLKLTERKPGETIGNFAWSPDGLWIAAIGSIMDFSSNGIAYLDTAVYVLKTDGSGTVKRVADSSGLLLHVEWMPDSKHVVYTQPGGPIAIASIETDEIVLAVLNNPPIQWKHREFNVSSDGKFMVYIETDTLRYSLHAVNLEGILEGEEPEDIILFTEAFGKGRIFSSTVGDLSISPDGARMLFAHSDEGKSTLRMYSVGDDAPITLAELDDCTSEAENHDSTYRLSCYIDTWRPGWSADGQWIVYATSRLYPNNDNGDVYIMKVAQVITGNMNPQLQVSGGRRPDW